MRSLTGKFPFLNSAIDANAKSNNSNNSNNSNCDLQLDFSLVDLQRAFNFTRDLISGSVREWPRGLSEVESLKLYANCRLLCFASQSFAVQKEFATSYSKIVKLELFKSLELTSEVAKSLLTSFKHEESNLYSVDLVEFLLILQDLTIVNLKNGKVYFTIEELAELISSFANLKALDYTGLDLSAVPNEVLKIAPSLNTYLPLKVQKFKEGNVLSRLYMKKILAGVGEGKRFYGAMAISIACQLDALSKEEALKVLDGYVKNCCAVSANNAFTMQEAQSALEWTYKRPSIRLSYEKLKSQGLISEANKK